MRSIAATTAGAVTVALAVAAAAVDAAAAGARLSAEVLAPYPPMQWHSWGLVSFRPTPRTRLRPRRTLFLWGGCM